MLNLYSVIGRCHALQIADLEDHIGLRCKIVYLLFSAQEHDPTTEYEQGYKRVHTLITTMYH